MGTAFTLVENVSANLREKESAWNTFLGGAAAGGIMGSTCKYTLVYFVDDVLIECV